MTRIALRFLPFLLPLAALAEATPDAPSEKASPMMVAAFLLLFVGGCAAYFVYLWWNHRKHPQGEAERINPERAP